MYRYVNIGLLGATSILTIAAGAQGRDDKQDKWQEATRYEDRTHHDSHEWNDKENQAYRRYSGRTP